MIKDSVKALSQKFFSEVVMHYRYLHQHPELSYEEENTSLYVASFLDKEGIKYRANIGGFGILAWIEGEAEGVGNTVALVADMDALPVREENNIEYKSKNDGVMHACGHDTHTSSLMGVAKIINSLKKEFSGTVLFVFQPGEEKSPGGADLMLKDGLFDEFVPDLVIKHHAYVDLPAGKIGFQSGTVMASADEVHVVVKGQGGHGALPHELNDTVLAASNVIVALQQVVSRRRNPFEPMTLSFGKFVANGATNVIPSEVTLAGSVRCMNEDERRKMLALIPEIINSTVAAYGCTADINMPSGYPCTISHEDITASARDNAVEYLGVDNVSEYPQRMTAEDFGFYTQIYPSCFYRFGVNNKDNNCGKLHSPTFLIDEQALKTAMGAMAYIALKEVVK